MPRCCPRTGEGVWGLGVPLPHAPLGGKGVRLLPSADQRLSQSKLLSFQPCDREVVFVILSSLVVVGEI